MPAKIPVQSYIWQFSPKNNVFIENIIVGVGFAGGESNFFYNNILGSLSGIGSYNIVKNNIFLTSSYALLTGPFRILSSTFENNIFITNTTMNYSGYSYFENNVFSNNLFVENISFPYATTNIGFNNIVNQTQNSIFVNQSGNSFNYAQDYHLKSTCPGKNAGRDGTDIGIYGGASPWKEGSIPFNPHFQIFHVGPTTDSTGNLNVNIKVAAQDR